MTFHRATSAEIDLSAFRHNLRTVRSLLAPDVGIMPVVKADAYGHGAVPCAKAALEAGADILGISLIEEGIELRENGIRAPILVLGSIFPDEIAEFILYDLSTALWSLDLARSLSGKAAKAGKTIGVHLKVDTGMGRLGMTPEEFPCVLQQVKELSGLRIDGVFTHLSSADEEDPEFTLQQLSRFDGVLQELKNAGVSVPRIHCANSAALLRFPQSHFTMVRPGIMLYGALTSPSLQALVGDMPEISGDHHLQPVMHWKSRILKISQVPANTPLSYGRQYVTRRQSRIATLPVGYADGLSRALSNKMSVLVKEKRVPQVGTICMDFTMIDVTDVPGVREGEEVVLFGRQGKAAISVDEMAQWCDTITYELLCAVSKRVPRIYLP